MKFVFYLSTIGLASASLKSLHANVAKFAENRPKAISTDPNNLRSGNRAFAGFIKNMFQAINGYGCWCYLDGGWRDDDLVSTNRPAIQAHGMAVDPIDESCRDLINAYGRSVK